MDIKGVAVIIAPGDPVWRGEDFTETVTNEDGSEEQAREILMVKFANTTLGGIFEKIDRTDAWHFWQIAEKNGFQIKIFDSFPIILDRSNRVPETVSQ
jgi:hypothetical protein